MNRIRATKLPHHKEENVGTLCSCSKHGQRERHLTNKDNCCFSQSTAFALIELEGFAFIVYLLWLLILGFFYCLWREGTVRGRHSHSLNSMVTFPLSSVRAALANRQYFDHTAWLQFFFSSSSGGTLDLLLIWQIS